MGFWTVFAIVLGAASFTASYVQAKKAQKKAKRLADEMAGVLVNKESNIEAIPVVYGERRVGGVRVFMSTSGDDRHEYLYVALVVAEGEVEQISDLEIDEVPATDSRFQGLVSYHYKLGTDDQTTSSILDDALITVDNSDPNWEYQGIVVTNQAFVNNFRLRGVAYVAIRLKYDAEVFNGVPDFTVKVKGRKVYDPRKDSTSTHYDSSLGVSTHREATTSTWEWTDNPALCLRDYLTNERFGKGLDATDLDDGEFVQAADDLDSFTVTPYSGASSGHKLFRLNAVIDTNEEIFANVEKILLSCRGFLPYTFGKYGLKIDQASTSVMTLDTSTIIGDINIVGSRKEDRFNQVIVKFPDANTRFQPNNAVWPNQSSTNPTLVSDGGSGYLTEAELHDEFLTDDDELLVDEVDLEYCTDYYAARDLARIFLWRSRTAINVALQATSEAMELTVGDVVSITHPTPNWTAKKFQVDEMSINYDGTVTLKCVEYDSTIYTYDPAAEEIEAIDIIRGDPGNVQPPTNVSGNNTGSTVLDDGTFHAVLNVSWTASPDATVVEYQVRYKLSTDTAYKYLTTTDTSVRIEGMTPGLYNIAVRALDFAGGKSDFVTGTNVDTDVDTSIPGDVTDLSFTSGVRAITVEWSNPTDADYAFTEIHVKTSNVTPQGTDSPTAKVAGEEYVYPTAAGVVSRYFFLRAVDRTGNKGSFTGTTNNQGSSLQASEDDIGDDQVTIHKIANTLQSTNYVAGTSGWKLTTAGDFEAGNGDFRGTVKATVLDVEDANVHGTLTATNIAAGIVTADTLAADVFAEFDDRYGGSGGFYQADNDEFFDGSATKYVTLPTVTHDNSKSIRFQCNLVHAWGTTSGYGGTNGLKLRVTFEYSADNTTWAKVPGSGENSNDYYERSATATIYSVTTAFDLAVDIRYEMTGSSLSDNTAYYFRVKIEYVSATNAFTSAAAGSANGVPIKFNVQQTAGLTAAAGDADTVDGLQASQFLRSDTSDTFSGNLTVTGNLTVQGSQTQLDTQTLTVEDNNIVLNYSTGDSSGSADNSGITIQDAVNSSTDASLLWKATGDYFQFSHPINAISSASNAYAAEFRGAPQPQGPSGMVSNGVKITAGSASTDTVLLVQELDNTAILTINGFGQTTFANSVTIDGESVTSTKIGQWDTAYGWGDHSTQGYLTSVGSINFNDLANKGSGTGTYSTSGIIESGRGSGGVALTINDGYGNANVTWNHASGVPEQNGNSARIEVNTDATSGATMYFELGENVTSGSAVSLTSIARFNMNGLYMESGKYIYGSGGVTINADDTDFVVQDLTDGTTNFIWRDWSGSKLYLGTSTAQVHFRSHVTQDAGYNITSSGIIEATKFRVERGSYETALVFEDSNGNDSIIHSVNDSQGNYNIMVGVNDAGTTTTAGYGQAKILMSAHSQNGAVSLNAGPTQATAGSTANYSISIMADSTDNSIRVGNPNDNVGGDPGSLTKVFDNSANAFATSYSVGSDSVISSTRRFYASDGTSVKAAYSFDGDSGTGISHTATGRIDFLSSGAIKAYIKTGTSNPISPTMYVDGRTEINGVVTWTGGSSTNANTAYSWGDHSVAGYLETNDNITVGTISSDAITASGHIQLNKQGTADASNQTYSSRDLQFLASGWDTNNSVARDVMWKIRNVPTASVYPDHDLQFIESDQGSDYIKFELHGRGSTNHTDPRAGTFFGNLHVEAGSGTNAGAGSLTVADTISSGAITTTDHISLPDSKYIRFGDDNDFIIYHDGATNYIQTVKQDSDLIIRGNDGGTNFNALTIDMSAAGNATFNSNVTGVSFITGTASSSVGIYAGGTQIFEGSTRNLKNIGSINSASVTTTNNITSSGNIQAGTSTGYLYAKSLRLVNGEVADSDFQHAYQMIVDANDTLSIMSNKGDFTGGYPFGIFFLGDNGGTTKTLGDGLVGVWNTTNFKKAHVDHMVGLYDGTQDLTAPNISVTGNLDVVQSIRHTGDVDTGINFFADQVVIKTGGTDRLNITNSDINIKNTQVFFNSTMGIGAITYAPIENNADSERNWVNIHRANNASYIEFTNRTPAGKIVLSGGLDGGGGEVQRLEIEGGSSTKSVKILASTDLNLSSTSKLTHDTTTVIDASRNILANGTASSSVPRYAFSGDSNTGLGYIGADQVGLIAGGSRKFYVSSTQAYFQNLSGGVNLPRTIIAHSESSGMKLTATDSTADASFYGFHIDYNASGSDTTTADRIHSALYIDADSSASGGGTSHEHRFYGAYITATASGDSDIIDGAFMQGRADNFGTGNQVTYLRGNNAMALAHHDAGIVSNTMGVYGYGQDSSSGSGQTSNIYGGYFVAYGASSSSYNSTNFIGARAFAQIGASQSSDIASAVAVWGEVQLDNDTAADHDVTISSAFCFRAEYDENDADDTYTVNNGYLYYGNYAGTLPTTAWGVYIVDAVENYFAGSIRAYEGYKVGSTQVIDASRNLTNIGSITASGNLTISGNANEIGAGSNQTVFLDFKSTSDAVIELNNSTKITIEPSEVRFATNTVTALGSYHYFGTTAQDTKIGTGLNGRLEFDVNGVEFLRLDGLSSTHEVDIFKQLNLNSNDVVGVGTFTSSGLMTVTANSGAEGITVRGRSSDNISELTFANNSGGTNYSGIQARSTYMAIRTISSIPILLQTDNTERGRLHQTGELTIGKNSATIGVGASDSTSIWQHGMVTTTVYNHGDVQEPTDVQANGALSGYYAFIGSGSVYVGCVEPNTVIYEYDPSDGSEKVFAVRGPEDTSTVTVVSDKIYRTRNQPFVMHLNGDHSALVPLAYTGQYFGFYTNRYTPDTIRLYAPTGGATVNIYHNDGIDGGTVDQTIVLLPNEAKSVATSNGTGTYLLEVIGGHVIASKSGTSGDRDILRPASRIRVFGDNTFGIVSDTEIFSFGGALNSSSRIVYSLDEPVIGTKIGDGAGGDCLTGVPLQMLCDNYLIPHSVAGMSYVAVYPDTEIKTYYHDGSAWVLAESISLSSNILTGADSQIGDMDSGGSGHINSGGRTILVTGNKPFMASTNDPADDEYELVGWLSKYQALATPEPRVMALSGGTQTDPAVTFENDDDTGIYRSADNKIGFTAGNALRFEVATDGINVKTGDIKIADTSIFNSSRKLENVTGGYFTGNVGINANNPDVELQVNGNNPTLRLRANTTTGTCRIQFADTGDNDIGNIKYSHSTNSMQFTTGDTERMRLDSSGNLVVTGNVTAYGTPSDIRLKENIERIDDPINKVKQLDGITFDYKKDGSRSTGLIAQQLLEVLPEVVYETDDLETGETHYAVRYGQVVGLLVEAVKELTQRIEELENGDNKDD